MDLIKLKEVCKWITSEEKYYMLNIDNVTNYFSLTNREKLWIRHVFLGIEKIVSLEGEKWDRKKLWSERQCWWKCITLLQKIWIEKGEEYVNKTFFRE